MASKKHRPVVRGPQLKLKIATRVQGRRAAKGEPPRTARVRYVEPPHKVTGNPFIAFRAPRELRVAFVRYCKKRNTSMPVELRAYMSRATGVRVAGRGEVVDGE